MIASLLAIFYQDQKERMVDWWFFLIGAIGLAILHIQKIGFLQFGIHISMNSLCVLLCLLVVASYTKMKIPTYKFTEAFALGDILFFCMILVSFGTMNFMILLSFGMILSLILHSVLKKMKGYKIFGAVPYDILQREYREKNIISEEHTAPMAGYLAIFFAGVLLIHWLGFYDHLYLM
ncbi:hypothetical protein SAMN06265376_1146 [Dokdonia pacifica]|uniref:Prepilin type IV endopeptidase peptidase domain-containing protein n=1 Tax=Dokdonia pacifica TaxID=1627892 RepID=A0A239E5J1_9FLAO|nr:hypothetical protein SAMN06265376_1146 [Dokdonia pacifica]